MRSLRAVNEVLDASGLATQYSVLRGAHPMQYFAYPSESEGVDFIIDRARAGREDEPLWVVAIRACTSLASTISKDPSITPKVRFAFHCRSPECGRPICADRCGRETSPLTLNVPA